MDVLRQKCLRDISGIFDARNEGKPKLNGFQRVQGMERSGKWVSRLLELIVHDMNGKELGEIQDR